MEIRVLSHDVIEYILKGISHIQRLWTYPRSEEIAMVIAVVIAVHAVLPESGEVSAGTSECAELAAVIEELCALCVVIDPAAVAVLSLLSETCAVEEPHHSLLRMVCISAELFCISSPVAKAVGVVYPLGDTCLSGARPDYSRAAVSL